MGKNDWLWATLGGGLVGWLLAKDPKWEQQKREFERRLQTLKAHNVVYPVQFLFNSGPPKAKEVYKEGVMAYLFGLPNSAVPVIVRSLEMSLRAKYREQ